MRVLIALFVLLSMEAQAKTLVISDIDDTLKRTSVLGYFTGGLRTTNPFTGLPKLFNHYLCNNEPTDSKKEFCIKFRGHNHSKDRSLIYVTAASGRLQMFGREFISRSNFPQVPVIGKEIGRDTLKFKIQTIKEIIQADKYDEVILIGDNGEHDVGAYKAIELAFPKVKISSFIHRVYDPYSKSDEKKGVGLESGQVAFFTASDLALEFYVRGLISSDQLKTIAGEVRTSLFSNDEDIVEQVIPAWSSCRGFINSYKRPAADLTSEISSVLGSIEARLMRVCR